MQGVLHCATGLKPQHSSINGSSLIPDNAPSLPLYTCRVVDYDQYTGNSTTWWEEEEVIGGGGGGGADGRRRR
jgi:hypothetical protein